MAEYIEREAALKVLCDACGNAACPKGLIPRCSYYEKMQSIPAADAIEELSRDLDSMNEANIALYGALPRWIPVTERLPEEAGYYITAFSKGEVGQNLYMTFADRRGKWYQNSEDTGEVTHWMPLPEPPKEEAT